MSILDKIKEFINKITSKKTLKLEEGKVVAPKEKVDFEKENFYKPFRQILQVTEEEKVHNPVSFEPISNDKVEELYGQIEEKGGRVGWTHSEVPVVSGKLDDKNFICLKRPGAFKEKIGETICLENGYYDITTLKDDINKGSYEERLTAEDGTTTYFSAGLGKDNERVRQVISKDGISLSEVAESAVMYGQAYDFEHFAQPSNDLLEEYAKATGLPVILAGDVSNDLKKKPDIPIDGLINTMRKMDEKVVFPYIVTIEAMKEAKDDEPARRKTIKYLYSSLEEYKSNKLPKMVYVDGVDGRTGNSGMFRLLEDKGGDIYIDNSTFRKENGKYVYDTKALAQIMELTGAMYPKLSKRAKSAIMEGTKLPPEIAEIYSKALKIEAEKERDPEEQNGQEI